MSRCRQALRAALDKLFGIRCRSEAQPVPRRRAPEPPADDMQTIPGYYIALSAQPGPLRMARMRPSGRRWPAMPTEKRRHSPDHS